jgi:hypothetical protein
MENKLVVFTNNQSNVLFNCELFDCINNIDTSHLSSGIPGVDYSEIIRSIAFGDTYTIGSILIYSNEVLPKIQIIVKNRNIFGNSAGFIDYIDCKETEKGCAYNYPVYYDYQKDILLDKFTTIKIGVLHPKSKIVIFLKSKIK